MQENFECPTIQETTKHHGPLLSFLAKWNACRIRFINNIGPKSIDMQSKSWRTLMFGEYVETHEEPTVTNSMQPRTRPAICLGPIENFQSSIKFMCMETGLEIV